MVYRERFDVAAPAAAGAVPAADPLVTGPERAAVVVPEPVAAEEHRRDRHEDAAERHRLLHGEVPSGTPCREQTHRLGRHPQSLDAGGEDQVVAGGEVAD